MTSSANRGDRPGTPETPSLAERIDQNIESVVALQRREWETVRPSQRRVERIGRFLGRPAYLLALLLAITAWISLNLVGHIWDPPPFELLDSIMTLISLVTTTVVLIAQNRQSKLEQQHTQLALQVSLLTEQKVTKLIGLLEELRRDMPMVKDRYDPHAEVLKESADTAKVVAALKDVGTAKQGKPPV
jgi:uncharacterized membrane protein